MIHGLKPYPVVKDSGDPWLGPVPEHWGLRSLGSLTSSLSLRGRPDLPLLSVVRERGVIPRFLMSDEENHNFVPDDLGNYKVVRTGNLVINKMKAWQGSLGIAPVDGVVSPAYFVFDFKIGDRRFGQTLLRSKTYVGFFARASDGVRIGQWDLSIYDMKRIPVIVPPLSEQSAIVRFLDYADRRIQRYIRAKKKLIALLNDQKQAIIHSALTRGLNPNVRLKPSGVEWLGDVPENWQVIPLRRVTLSCCDGPFGSGLKSLHYTDHGIRVVRLQNIGHAEFKNSDAAFISPKHYATLGDHSVEAGDVLVAGLGDERHPAGRACVAPDYIAPAMVKADCFRFRINEQILSPEFLALHLTATAVAASSILSTGATRQRVNLSATASRMIAIPSPEEQEAICSHISRNTGGSVSAMTAAQREIDLLREYRTRLIADVVTGKLDVREAASRLPEEADEPAEESEILVEGDEGCADVDLEAAEELEA